MATSTEGRIMEALFERLEALSLSPALPIAWPNKNYTPPAGGKFLRVQFMPNATDRVTIPSDGPHRFQGLLQVSVMWPLNKGEGEPRDVAGAIADHFTPDLRLVSGGVEVRITKRPDVADLLIEDHRSQIPVTIEYEAYA